MKVIDLINDLFDYRELQPDKLPKKIRFNNEEFVFKSNSYYNENDINIMAYVNHTLDLRVEIEIIEEDKEIEKLDYCEEHTFSNMKESTYLSSEERRLLDSNFKSIKEKFDELIKAVNELKKGK